MTDKELKRMLKNVYDLPVTDKKKRFIRSYEKRSFHIIDVLKLEFRYMGLQSILAGVVLCLLCLFVVKVENIDTIWIFSSMIPFCAVIPMIFLSKSERHGMDEMEASCRFSLRFVRLVRMCIIGVFTLGLFLSMGIIMKTRFAIPAIDFITCVITPYLVSDFGAMLVTRRWHGKENIYGIFAVCILSSFAPFALKSIRSAGLLPDSILVLMSVLLLMGGVRECIKYVKESENISWNLC